MQIDRIPANESYRDRFQILNYYCDQVEPTTEAPRDFHAFALLALLSILVGRTVRCGRTYPLISPVLVGDTGSHKSTAISEAMSFLRADVMPHMSKPPRVWRGASTGLGLLEELQNGPTLVAVDEFAPFLTPHGGAPGRMVREVVHAAFDAEAEMVYRTARTCITVPFPTAVLLGSTTPAWMADVLSPDIIRGGTASRLIFVEGAPSGRDVPVRPPRSPELAHFGRLVAKYVEALNGRNLDLTEQATAMHRQKYSALKASPAVDDLAKALRARRCEQALRLALLLAISSGSREIETPDIETGWQLAEQSEGVVNRLLDRRDSRTAPASDAARVLRSVEGLVRGQYERAFTFSEIYSRLKGERGLSAERVHAALQSLVDDGHLHKDGDHFRIRRQ